MDLNINIDESIDDLQLNGLRLIQKKSGFRFGVDAVLLSDFANVKKKHRVLDLCTGTGIVPFLIHGKYSPKEVWGVEIQEEMVEMANILNEVSYLSRQLTAEYRKDIYEDLSEQFTLLGDIETEGCTLYVLKDDFKEIEAAVVAIKKWCVGEMHSFRRLEQTAYSSSITRLQLVKKCSEIDKGVVIYNYV